MKSEDEPAAKDDFLFGLVPTPDFLSLGGWFRYDYIWNTVGGTLVDRSTWPAQARRSKMRINSTRCACVSRDRRRPNS